jgi:hypothetical protein
VLVCCVVLPADTDPVKHARLAALQRSRALLGAEPTTSRRVPADSCPGEFVSALVQQAFTLEVLTGWAPATRSPAAATTWPRTCRPGQGTRWSGRC